MTMIAITDEMLRAAIEASKPDRIQGFSTPVGHRGWGAPHIVIDTRLPPGHQEIWRGDDETEFHERCEMERMRVALAAALSVGECQKSSNGSEA
jgi:hypothetical protein